MYAKCGDFKASSSLFSNMETKSTVSWNTLISLGKNPARPGCPTNALKLFGEMMHSGNKLDLLSLSSGLATCSDLTSLEEGQEIHGLSLSGFNLKFMY
jgi:hypothetical protein